MKKFVSIAVISAAVALAPAAASAHSKHKGYHHGPEAVVLLGAGIGAGAIIAGPVGAAVGGVAVLVVGHVAHIAY